ncbi:MAG: CoA-binding protein [Gammaproteobacteria bacterium]|nr:CoA-binding protein [Gammaproteobacteria bacterium]MCP5138058.1 CoA-binding protein [Gammaproteobacteria bacterium]
MSARFVNPPEAEIRALLARVGNIAVVGLSPKPGRPSHFVAEDMQRAGYRIIPVRPGVGAVLGETAYSKLDDVPDRIDLVNVFLNPGRLPMLIDQCIALQVPAIWMQIGVVDHEQAERATEAGIFVVMDRCIAVDYNRLNIRERRDQ